MRALTTRLIRRGQLDRAFRMETNTELRLHLEERGVPTLFARGTRLGPKSQTRGAGMSKQETLSAGI